MATKKAAESTLYHVHSKGFWKKFRDAVVVNPDISSGIPIAGINRYPPPGSRPEQYATPATKASDPAANPYWKRDVRRAYPQLSVITQSDLATLLIEHAEVKAVTAPRKDTDVQTMTAEDLPGVIATVTSATQVYDESRLPPRIPTAFKKWKAQVAPNAPHDPHSYFPMMLYN